MGRPCQYDPPGQLTLFDLRPWTLQRYACYTGRTTYYFYHKTEADPLIDHVGPLACWPVHTGPESEPVVDIEAVMSAKRLT